ncbi:TIGR02444 family protein [Halomonas sp. MCCC 1A17488]|uniref:TIGR02444 family protein n=1 Tax=unclassified Halomonas TaxID=2609666 RepID=UPI0018D25704|nr:MULTISPECIES: TIGR02444 family protein [unclassified Halomonas]MCE8017423.1 TIGR02444 family protein [Halomonas sp. MCCC 1A17488]MCG3240756.1 TIGR02444 family protein [Halomonas sp. MCCC 1A17488]QPP49406.1 TIGR02444 family protein [Halomonas sp. SS10-MC5]
MSDDSTATTAALRAGLGADPLWDFALAFYARPGVEAACLRLQDEAGVDVCELLWHCWLYRHGLTLAAEPVELEAIRHWQCEVTRPLRRLRRQLKAEAACSRGVAEVRRQLQQAELAAERETLERLQRLAEQAREIAPLPAPAKSLEISLASRWKLQKKAQLLAVQTLEYRLDPL